MRTIRNVSPPGRPRYLFDFEVSIAPGETVLLEQEHPRVIAGDCKPVAAGDFSALSLLSMKVDGQEQLATLDGLDLLAFRPAGFGVRLSLQRGRVYSLTVQNNAREKAKLDLKGYF